jgi:hypothetical protein
LLQQQPVAGVEKKHGEGAVQAPLRLTSVEAVRVALRGAADYGVAAVDQDALVPQQQVLLAACACRAWLTIVPRCALRKINLTRLQIDEGQLMSCDAACR